MAFGNFRNAGRHTPGGDAGSTGNGGVPFVVHVKMESGDTTNKIYDAELPGKHRVLDAWYVMHGAGAASDTVKITDGTNDITDDVDVSAKSDKDRANFGQIDDARYEIADAGTLAVTTASGALVEVYILLVPVK